MCEPDMFLGTINKPMIFKECLVLGEEIDAAIPPKACCRPEIVFIFLKIFAAKC